MLMLKNISVIQGLIANKALILEGVREASREGRQTTKRQNDKNDKRQNDKTTKRQKNKNTIT